MANRTSTRGDAGRRRVSQVHAKKSGSARSKGSKGVAGRGRKPSSGGNASARPRVASKRSPASKGSVAAPKKAAASRKAAPSRKSAPSKASSASKTRVGGRPPSSPTADPQPEPPLLSRLFERIRYRAGPQTPDLIGLVLVGAGLLVALAFFESSGPLGLWALDGVRSLVGLGAYIVPALLLVLGGALLLGRHEYQRLVFGAFLGFMGSLSLFHLISGNTPLAGDIERVRQTGGAIGALTAFPLDRLIGFWGTFLLLSAVTAAGVMAAMGASVRDVMGAAWDAMFYAARQAKAGFSVSSVSAPAPRRERRPVRLPEAVRTPPPLPETPPEEAEAEAPPEKASSKKTSSKKTSSKKTSSKKTPPKGKKKARPAESKPAEKRADAPPPAPADGADGYVLPPLELLKTGKGGGESRRSLEDTARRLESALHHHDVDAELTNVVPGPTITRYEIELAPGVKVSRVTRLAGDIAYALATPDIRLLAPIPGRSAIGVEVPNRDRRLVTLGDVLSSDEAARTRAPLAVGLGEDISGSPEILDLEQLPHVLIAGATGAGKSSCINSIVTSLLMRCRPDDVRLIMVDPKRVELGQYNGVPHLLTRVITNPKKAVEALQWAVAEMDRRYELLAEGGVRDIAGYRGKYDSGQLAGESFDRFPYLVVLIDELNDLMMVAGRDVENAVVRLAQMARAVGIHLVIATQRPSVNVITGVIKANIPSRLAFSVASQTDSRVIIDTAGAEKLIGMGDMLVVTAREPQARRVQGAWVSEEEVSEVVEWAKAQKQAEYREIAEEAAVKRASTAEEEDDEDADLIRRAAELVVRSQLGSTSMLQRKLRVGFARAGRIMDVLEQRGVVGPSAGSKAREVLITVEELEGGSEGSAAAVPGTG